MVSKDARLIDKMRKKPNKVIAVTVRMVVAFWGSRDWDGGRGGSSGVAGQVLFLDWVVFLRYDCLTITH